jgi:capsular polysaccharide export protein
VLVTGQVEDDRSILSGGGAVRSNLDLLKRARMAEADAYIIYKPHPDVEAGHRIGHIAEDQALIYADAIIRDQPIGALLDMVDAVHVITSLAGFEGLLRGKQVTTHGLPFYAGWGLTTDLAEIPHRRGTRRSLLELIAATLILYPRYMDPVTGLPCPPEVLIERMASGADRRYSALVEMRRVQGKAKRWLAARIGRGLS